ncbi:MAG: TrmH family RNA methyltransferase [Ignavibacteriaceae bacterium]
MISKNDLKYYSSLLNKKFRQEENKFIVEGEKIVNEGLDSNFTCEVIFLSKSFAEENGDFVTRLKKEKQNFEIIKEKEFEKLSDTISPQGIAAIFHKPKKKKDFEDDLVIALENISDPGNVGTIIRNCDWFGIKEIILGENCAEVYNPKTIRASMGSIFHLNINENVKIVSYLNLVKTQGYKIYCTDLNGKNLFDMELQSKSVIVFSNEANGPSGQLLNISDEIITIPKYGSAESLNVASASAVILSYLAKK